MKAKGKGPRNERRLSRALSLLISEGEREDLLWRSAMSGGRATVQRKRGVTNLTQGGDISAIAADSSWLTEEWFIEAKHYKDLEIVSSFIKNKGTLARFWSKCISEAESYNKRPMLIAKQNRIPELLIVKRGQRLNGSAIPPITLRAWNADVYLFSDIERLTASKRARIVIDEGRPPRVILEED